MSRLSRALRVTLVEYFKKTSLNGFGLLYYNRRRRYQRFFWFLFIAAGICSASFVVFATLLQFLARPTITALSTLSVSQQELPLPPLTICSRNKLSRHKLQAYAEQLAARSGNTTAYWLQELQLLAGYFRANSVSAEPATRLQVALADNWSADVRAQFLQLSPSCASLLLSCHIDEVEHNCSSLFRLTPTIEGNCCVLQAGNITTEHLQLRLNASRDDDFYLPHVALTAAYSVHLPGWLGRLHVAAGEFKALQVRALRLQADEQLRSYPVAERGCHFADEAAELVLCLPQCRLRAVLAACHCAPFYYSVVGQHNFSYCNLTHTACLQQLEANWSPWSCVHCLPACNDWRYELRQSLLGHVQPLETKLSIRHGGQRVPLYSQDGLYHWYELLSNVGGVLSVCIGCSFISGFEIVYFMVFRLWQNWRH
ncbi:pickpocket protein 11 [Drosophila nasuta]|uniref:pickpocket protein 11 n=1 Tax=Drosophila nasuta TaxID=42062 RepID=UPI00295EF864|nr:pickpocket protein 11 [Drosophila nasuta]